MQQITIHCRNIIAVFDSKNNTYENALKLVSFDDEDVTVDGKKSFRYKVLEDTCKVRDDNVIFTLAI